MPVGATPRRSPRVPLRGGLVTGYSRARLWVARFHRQHGPHVRFWDENWNLLYAEPVKVESWRSWFKRQARRLVGA